MGIFDNEEDDIDAGGGGLRADPDALVDFFDAAATAAEEYAAGVAQRAEDDPLGLAGDVISTAGSVINPMMPQVEVDTSDGVAVKMSNLLSEAGVGVHADGHVTGDMSATAGPLGGIDGHVLTDADGNITKASGEFKASIDEVGVEGKAAYEDTVDGFKASGEYGVHAPIEGVPIATEFRAGYEDLGDHGYKMTGGMSGGLYAEEAGGWVEGTAMAGFDVDYSTIDGQQTVGLRENIELGAEIAGQDLGEAKLERGIAYTTGPDGDRIITHEQGSVRVGTEETNVSGNIRNEHEFGTDAQGNEVDRTTVSTSASADIPQVGLDVSETSSSVYDNTEVGEIADGIDLPFGEESAIWDESAGLDATYDEAAEAGAPTGGGYSDPVDAWSEHDEPVDAGYADPGEVWSEQEPVVLEETADGGGSDPVYEDTVAPEPFESYEAPETVMAESYSE
jgi:hypothetical protein